MVTELFQGVEGSLGFELSRFRIMISMILQFFLFIPVSEVPYRPLRCLFCLGEFFPV